MNTYIQTYKFFITINTLDIKFCVFLYHLGIKADKVDDEKKNLVLYIN